MTSNVSGSFLLMMLLYLWPMLLSVVGWIIVFPFQESLQVQSNRYVNYNVSKVLQLELYQAPVDTPV